MNQSTTSRFICMKRTLLLAAVAVGLFTGCASRYKVTLNNGNVLTTSSRPKLDKATNSYTYKDAQGKTVVIPAGRIREIEPLSRKSKPDKFQYN
jgi:ABC-type Fe3+-hydroxamate transport system substrate-binding protein